MVQLELPGTAPPVLTLDLEPLLRGEVIEALAAVLLRPWDARAATLEQSENSREVAE